MSEKDFEISIRPEIRKGCLWDIQFVFSQTFLNEHNLNQLVIDKAQKGINDNAAYLCLKVRSKLLDRELGLNKVCEIERNSIPISQESGIAILKVKFTQRPRSVFHKHSDVMILVASVRSLKSNEILATNEVELIFRGGTGSSHSAESKKRKISDRNDPSIPQHHHYPHHPVHPSYSTSSQIHHSISPSPYIHEDENISSSDETDSYYSSPIYSPINKKMCLVQHQSSDDQTMFSSLLPFNQLEDDPFYISQLNDIHESMELIEWSKKEGLLNDDLLIENENIYGNEMAINQQEKFDINEEIRKFKEEMMMMVNEKIESFKKRMDERLMIEMRRKSII